MLMHGNEHLEVRAMRGITNVEEEGAHSQERWVEIDRHGDVLAGRQGELDVEIGDWLIAARDEQVHEHLGHASWQEYVERRIGLAPHSAMERARVADSLTKLKEIREALRSGALAWSVVREISRVAVPETEREWLEAASGKTVRDAQQFVSGRRPGQGPSDPADPRLRRYGLHHDLGGEEYAYYREAVRSLRKELGADMTEEQALVEMARRTLGGPRDEGRAPYQVALTRCEDCQRVWQDAHGEPVEVPAEVLERANCDAQHIGHVDGSSHGGRKISKAWQSIPPAVRREVIRRDHGRCRVDSCRNSTWIEVHHLWPQGEGGPHDPRLMACLCWLCRTRHNQHYADRRIMPRRASPVHQQRENRGYAAAAVAP